MSEKPDNLKPLHPAWRISDEGRYFILRGPSYRAVKALLTQDGCDIKGTKVRRATDEEVKVYAKHYKIEEM